MADFAPYGEAIAKASELFNNILKRVLPAKMDEKDAAELSNAVTLELMKGDLQQIMQEYGDRASARALAAADVAAGNWFTNVLSATVRPFFGYLVMATFMSSIATQVIPHIPAIVLTDIHKEIMLSVIYFYFGGRTVEKGLTLWRGGNK